MPEIDLSRLAAVFVRKEKDTLCVVLYIAQAVYIHAGKVLVLVFQELMFVSPSACPL